MGQSIREIVDAAQAIIGEVAGAGVQAYGDDRMFNDCIQIFDMLHKKYYWPQFLDYSELTLDGATGRVTLATAFNYVRDFEDIYKVWPERSDTALNMLPLGTNPYRLSGSRPLYYSSIPANDAEFVGKRIRIWPVTATGKIQVASRIHPLNQDELLPDAAWDWDDIMELDFHMLVHGTAWRTLSNDDINPKAAADQMALMEGRFNDITKRYADMPLAVGGQRGVPMTWHETP